MTETNELDNVIDAHFPQVDAPGKGFDEPKGARLWRATDLKPAEQPRWLARRRMPRAAVSLLVGGEGIGKSLLWVWMAAAVTTGKEVPEFGIPARSPEDVFVVVTEDDWSSTVRPRLEASGADLSRVYVLCADEDGSGAPTFPADMHLVTGSGVNPGLIVVDAWLDTVPGGLSVKDPQQARRALHPWKEAATRTGASVLLLTHTNRMSTGNARDMYGASGELRKKARMTLFAIADPERPGHLIVGPEKSNLVGAVEASRFRIDGVRVFEPTSEDDGTVPVLELLGDTGHSMREHIEEVHAAQEGGPASAREGAVAWLREFLEDGDGSQEANEVFKAADANGFSKDQARRAMKDIGVESKKVGTRWVWVLTS